MNVVRLPQAYNDLVEIAAYLAEDDPAVADRLYDLYEQTLAAIQQNPQIGSLRETINHGTVRMWFVKNFNKVLIFYRETKEEIVILRLLHVARDYTRLM